jgi:hypothetical protein
MAAWLRNTLLAVLVVGLTWSAAVAYWRGSASAPSPTDMILVMLGLPLLLLGGLWYGRRLLAPAASTPAAAPAAAPDPTPATAAEAPALSIVAASLRMPHGASAAELRAALERGNARATLDPELTGDDGYPVMSVRAQAAMDADGREQVAAWIDRHGGDAGQLYEEHLRALLLGGAVAAELAALAADAWMPAGAQAPALQLALLPPTEWNADLRRAALLHLRQAVLDAGWPEAQVLPQIVDDVAALLPGGARHSPLTLLVACASHVGEYTVNEWSADLTLFSAAHQQGLIPGEGAAGLLLSAQAAPSQARISGAWALRESSADSERKPDSRLLANLVTRTLQEAAVPPAAVAAVVADTGHRISRTMELMGLVRDAFPHLDTATDVLATGTASGSCADAAFVAALALAAEQAEALQAPVLCVTNEDPFRRSALLVRPAPPTP